VKQSERYTADFVDLTLEEKIQGLHKLMETVIESPYSLFGEICKEGDMDIKAS
jgi:hypothetical protein